MKQYFSHLVIFIIVFGFSTVGSSQTPSGSPGQKDSEIVFQPAHPLINSEESDAANYRNTFGFTASFSDYGLALGPFYSHRFGPDVSGVLTLDIGSAKGSREFGFYGEEKINRIFVLPLIASAQYRLFREALSDNFRPYVTAGAGPVFVLTNDASQSYFPALFDSKVTTVPGGFVGVGANFGAEKKSNFGANLRYYIIPYPAGIRSTSTQTLTDLNGLFISVNYGLNF